MKNLRHSFFDLFIQHFLPFIPQYQREKKHSIFKELRIFHFVHRAQNIHTMNVSRRTRKSMNDSSSRLLEILKRIFFKLVSFLFKLWIIFYPWHYRPWYLLFQHYVNPSIFCNKNLKNQINPKKLQIYW